jgi:hypothetical protein
MLEWVRLVFSVYMREPRVRFILTAGVAAAVGYGVAYFTDPLNSEDVNGDKQTVAARAYVSAAKICLAQLTTANAGNVLLIRPCAQYVLEHSK